MHLSYIEIVDLFFRFITVGQLSLLSFYVLSKSYNLRSVLATIISISLSAYLLLTAPIADQHYGMLRGVLLFLTEIMPYILWCFSLLLLKDDFTPQKWPFWVKSIVALVLLWFLYFFGVLMGNGIFHQVNHALQLLTLLHIVYFSIKGLTDDLVNARRNARITIVMGVSLYFLFIVVLELGDSPLRSSSTFSCINGLLGLLATSVFSWHVFNNKLTDETLIYTGELEQIKQDQTVPLIYKHVHHNLCKLMDDGFYQEMQLTITELANKLSIPEHQLRELINKHLGFRNFSDFLNSYRLPFACSQLEDVTNMRKPILTIAFDLGYGSVATFNRAFKAKMGKTPKEYRNQFRK
jgi:AraC-like DNA-binding protein